MSIPARLNIVTLGVAGLARSIAFYEALGWERVASSQEEEICWFKTAGCYVGLWGYEKLAADAGLPAKPRGAFGGITLAMCLESEQAVTAALENAAQAGATISKPAEHMDWGGFSGYFLDPDGHPWEVAFNPFFPIAGDGTITIP
jgi:uncharacterized protein